MDLISAEALYVTLIGLAGGVVLGLAARLGGFCTLGAIEDFLYSGNSRRLRIWVLATGTGIALVHGLIALDFFDPAAAGILQLRWNVAGSVAGGLVFGYGMAMAGYCGFGALARLGGGDLRSFVILLVMGIVAYVTMSGILAFSRIRLFPQMPLDTTLPTIPAHVAGWTGLSPALIGIAAGLAVLAAGLSTRNLRADLRTLLWGVAVGLSVALCWCGTYIVATTGFEEVQVTSHTYTAPVGETILYLMTASGNTLTFGIGSVAGVVVGGMAGSLIKGNFRWEACDDPRELRRQMLGATLMGMGAVVALGCSIGQGLSAMVLLSLSAPVTLAAIFAGTALGLRQLIAGFHPAE